LSVLDELHAVEQRIIARLRELEPAMVEYRELQLAAERLGIGAAQPAPSDNGSAATAHAAADPAPAPGSEAAPRGGTQAVGVERRERVLSLISEHPGITVPELSEAIGAAPSPIYRVVRKLVTDGVVSRDGKRLQLV
jgi:hypothetical protein